MRLLLILAAFSGLSAQTNEAEAQAYRERIRANEDSIRDLQRRLDDRKPFLTGEMVALIGAIMTPIILHLIQRSSVKMQRANDAEDRRIKAEELALAVRESSRATVRRHVATDAKIDENSAMTAAVGQKADAAYHAANDSNAKIAAIHDEVARAVSALNRTAEEITPATNLLTEVGGDTNQVVHIIAKDVEAIKEKTNKR